MGRQRQYLTKTFQLFLPEIALTFNTLNSLSNILRNGTVSGEKKFPSFAKNTPFLKASSSSVVAGNSSFRQASIQLEMRKWDQESWLLFIYKYVYNINGCCSH